MNEVQQAQLNQLDIGDLMTNSSQLAVNGGGCINKAQPNSSSTNLTVDQSLNQMRSHREESSPDGVDGQLSEPPQRDGNTSMKQDQSRDMSQIV